ncbi:hypothetical protein Saci_0508 [Sulfolobus acidocaldarius DSM 639]|uniref:Uncharacterized protein n=1 Tax=Sulfolobus acidocaldarius (strain ATCC 33909 / DSM 639 / JCM 8929 / NBRC 15157 / NCIMB 11770) TaxID=330779 RepID=Q4JBB5_SULAC|nr:hypothetical protein Saci_0508 [Sulfolobus acidocaldarius DSM 639]
MDLRNSIIATAITIETATKYIRLLAIVMKSLATKMSNTARVVPLTPALITLFLYINIFCLYFAIISLKLTLFFVVFPSTIFSFSSFSFFSFFSLGAIRFSK